MGDFARRILTDLALHEELKNDPRGVLARHGRNLPDGVEITVVESTPENLYFVLPPPMDSDELSEGEFTGAVGGAIFTFFSPETK